AARYPSSCNRPLRPAMRARERHGNARARRRPRGTVETELDCPVSAWVKSSSKQASRLTGTEENPSRRLNKSPYLPIMETKLHVMEIKHATGPEIFGRSTACR